MFRDVNGLVILTCAACGASRRVDPDAEYDGQPVLDWWETVGRLCADCRAAMESALFAAEPETEPVRQPALQPPPVGAGMTVEQAQAWVNANLEDGVSCPVCGQMAKLYRRKVNSQMARTLAKIYAKGGLAEFVHAPSLPGDTHEASQLVWWGLVEEMPAERDDGGRAGWWRVTQLGEHFLHGRASIPKYALVYDGRVIDLLGENVLITEASGFNLAELMRGE